MKNRLRRCNLKVDEKVEETINGMTKRYTKAMLWNIDDRFPQVLNLRCFFNI